MSLLENDCLREQKERKKTIEKKFAENKWLKEFVALVKAEIRVDVGVVEGVFFCSLELVAVVPPAAVNAAESKNWPMEKDRLSLPSDVASRAQMMNAKREKKEKREASIFVSSWARHAAAGGERHPLREQMTKGEEEKEENIGREDALFGFSVSLSMIIIDVDPWSLTWD